MTIFALSSGPGISGIAVLRISGDRTKEIIKKTQTKKLNSPHLLNFSMALVQFLLV